MITLLNENDIDALVELEKELFPSSPWPKKEFLYEFNENPYSVIYGMKINDQIAGYVDLWITFEQAQIANIAVSTQFQRRGIGEKLLKYCVNQAILKGCENLSLEVRVSNHKAISLYEKLGFITVSTRKHYYEDGEDAYLMLKPLGGLEYDKDSCD